MVVNIDLAARLQPQPACRPRFRKVLEPKPIAPETGPRPVVRRRDPEIQEVADIRAASVPAWAEEVAP